MNSEISKVFDPHKLLLNLSDKIDLKEVMHMLLYQILRFTIHGKIQKIHTNIINLKYQLQIGMKNLNCLMNHILF